MLNRHIEILETISTDLAMAVINGFEPQVMSYAEQIFHKPTRTDGSSPGDDTGARLEGIIGYNKPEEVLARWKQGSKSDMRKAVDDVADAEGTELNKDPWKIEDKFIEGFKIHETQLQNYPSDPGAFTELMLRRARAKVSLKIDSEMVNALKDETKSVVFDASDIGSLNGVSGSGVKWSTTTAKISQDLRVAKRLTLNTATHFIFGRNVLEAMRFNKALVSNISNFDATNLEAPIEMVMKAVRGAGLEPIYLDGEFWNDAHPGLAPVFKTLYDDVAWVGWLPSKRLLHASAYRKDGLSMPNEERGVIRAFVEMHTLFYQMPVTQYSCVMKNLL